MEEWKVHFMRLLGGVKRKVVRRKERERVKRGREEEEELSMEKVKKAKDVKEWEGGRNR